MRSLWCECIGRATRLYMRDRGINAREKEDRLLESTKVSSGHNSQEVPASEAVKAQGELASQ